jgi:hypothetical protein
MQNTSLPSYENWANDEYVKLWNYLEENGMKNGELSEEDVKTVESKFGQLYTLKQEGNLPGIYLINPGDRVAQIKMGDDTRIRFITEEFLTDEQIEDLRRQGYTEDDIFKETEEIRTKHLQKVKTMGHDRGGGYGSTGING